MAREDVAHCAPLPDGVGEQRTRATPRGDGFAPSLAAPCDAQKFVPCCAGDGPQGLRVERGELAAQQAVARALIGLELDRDGLDLVVGERFTARRSSIVRS